MFSFGIICFVIWFICSIIIVINVSGKSAPLGCLTLILLPIMPFILVWTSFTGNKKLMIPLLYVSGIFGFSTTAYELADAKEQMAPFVENIKSEVNIDCEFLSVGTSSSGKEYTLGCIYSGPDKFEYKNIDELVEIYRTNFILKIAPFFPQLNNEVDDNSIVIGFYNESKINLCYRLKPSGEVTDSWYSGADDLCD
jgi:hypothetical protein